MADVVVRRIRRRCTEIQRAFHQGSLGRTEVYAINSSIANVRRVGDTIGAEAVQDIVQSLTDLRYFILGPQASSALHTGFHAAHLVHSGELTNIDKRLDLILTWYS